LKIDHGKEKLKLRRFKQKVDSPEFEKMVEEKEKR